MRRTSRPGSDTLILSLALLAAFACRGHPDAAPAPVPTPAPAVSTTSVSDVRSLWGRKGLDDNLNTVVVLVSPGSPAESERWQFDIGRSRLTCLPEPQATGWRFSVCNGLKSGESFEAFVPRTGDAGFTVKLNLGGRQLKGDLIRTPERDEPTGSPNVSLVWHRQGPPAAGIHTGIWADDGLVFAPRGGGTIEIFEAGSGRLVGSAGLAGSQGGPSATVLEVTARGGYLYAATGAHGLVIFDVHDPARPRLAGQYYVDAGRGSPESFTNVHALTLSPRADVIYAVNQSHPLTDLSVIDVPNPAAPREIGRFRIDREPKPGDFFHDVSLIERNGRLIAFLHSLSAGLFVLDITDPAAVAMLGSIRWEATVSHSGAAFDIDGRLYYAHNDEGFDEGMTVLEMTDLSRPRIVSRYQTRPGSSIHNIQILDGFAYLSYYTDGLRVVDLHDPAHPREVAHYDTVAQEDEVAVFQGAWGVRLLDGFVFISDMQSGIYAFKVDVGR